ncbi:MAG TPA: 5-formyltetrahydrofolate cyclo-ligase [Candidatus Binataceae bacterium]|nr:5-formyltetrahydrofolate cyclo-ligase [Candidatus Binataceae bacterium]
MAVEKKYFRAVMAASRSALDQAWTRAHSEQIQHHILSSPLYRGCRSIMIYAAAGGEVSTDLIFEAVLASRRAVFFPRIEKASNTISAVEVRSSSELRVGAFGILEPDPSLSAVDSSRLGDVLVCVPGLAFGREGHRLGRGGGHYDRFLANLGREAISVGLAYSFQLLDRVPHEEHDRRLNFIATESALLRSGDTPLLDGDALTEEVHPGASNSRTDPGIDNWWRGLVDCRVKPTAEGRR